MTYTAIPITEFLATTEPFNSLSPTAIESLQAKLQPLRYRMGQAIALKESLPAHVAILYEGQARLLGYPQGAPVPETLELLMQLKSQLVDVPAVAITRRTSLCSHAFRYFCSSQILNIFGSMLIRN